MNQTIVVNNITYCWNEILRKYTPSFLCDDPVDYLDDEIDISYQVAPGNPNFFSIFSTSEKFILHYFNIHKFMIYVMIKDVLKLTILNFEGFFAQLGQFEFRAKMKIFMIESLANTP